MVTEAEIGAASQAMPRLDGHRPKLGRGKEGFYSETERGHKPADVNFSGHLEFRTFSQ